VFNLDELSIIDCRELELIGNMFIQEKLYVRNCANLDNIKNIFGLGNLVLNDNFLLRGIDIELSNLVFVDILDCPNIIMTIQNTTDLKYMSIHNAGLVLLKADLPWEATINVNNASMLPNIDPTLNILKNNKKYTSVDLLRDHLFDMKQSISKIIRSMNRYLEQKKQKKINLLLSSSNECSICYNPYASLNDIYVTRCDHLFHKDCIYKWFGINRKCPNCNNDRP
jgi:hypothetical protein